MTWFSEYSASLRRCLAKSLSVVLQWTGSQGSVSPPVFPVNGSLSMAPPFPPPGPGEPGSPTSQVLWGHYDFLRVHSRSLMDSVPGSTCSSAFVVAEALPARRRTASRPGVLGQPVSPIPAVCTWARTGYLRFPGVPSHTSARLSDPGRIGQDLAICGPTDAAPGPNTPKAPAWT
jgi:hypothetical protein